jgi:hypothetical protein
MDEREKAGREDRSQDPDPHHALNNPVTDDPDLTEYPDPYDQRPDPKAPVDAGEEVPHVPPGTRSTSDPHPDQDIEAPDAKPPERDKLDD